MMRQRYLANVSWLKSFLKHLMLRTPANFCQHRSRWDCSLQEKRAQILRRTWTVLKSWETKD